MEKIIAYFYCQEDNYKRIHQVSYKIDTTKKEIINDLEHSFGKITIIGYENSN
jgi:hypothetical protein